MALRRESRRSLGVSDLALVVCVCLAWRIAASATSGTFQAQVIGKEPVNTQQWAQMMQEEQAGAAEGGMSIATMPAHDSSGYVENYGVCGGLDHSCGANQACDPCASGPNNYFEW